ncbi:hypothetical protein LTS08_001096 [Lithohypha guttulata]|uniref:uncharacterized protein n=1 Tax=Lithohypha guttulata TaxID=1690604 RepID=UPI002DDFF5E3|nr:hypothetical protein LTS08_001096 [Lithohypha guttulata]
MPMQSAYGRIQLQLRLNAMFAVKCCSRKVRLSPRTFQLLATPQNAAQQRSFAFSFPRRLDQQRSESEAEKPDEDNAGVKTQRVEDDVQEFRRILRIHGSNRETLRAAQDSHSSLNTWKNLMRTVTQPVAIVTARSQDTSDDQEGTFAATVSSFNSVSIEPDIRVSFNLTKLSTTYQTLRDSGYCSITFPRNTHRGRQLADKLARGNQQSPFKDQNLPVHLIPLKYTTRNQDLQSKELKYIPAAVALSGLEDNHASGLAFAFIGEYQTSIEVGDHVLVTARVLPDSIVHGLPHGWGMSVEFGSYYSHSHLTLSYVHGTYTNPETAHGLDKIWKLDDDVSVKDLSELKDKTCVKRPRCEARLYDILQAQSLKRRQTPRRDFIARWSRAQRRAADLPWYRLRELERHYMLWLAIYDVQDGRTTAPAVEAGESPRNNDKPWQQHFIRVKANLSDADLKDEEDLCTRRLANLAQQYVSFANTTTSPPVSEEQVPNDEEAGLSVDDIPQQQTHRLGPAELIVYYSNRLHLIREARRHKADPEPIEHAMREAHFQVQSSWSSSFVEKQKGKSLDALRQMYIEFQNNISRAQTWLFIADNRSGNRDYKAIDEARYRMDQLIYRRDLVGKLMRERAALAPVEEIRNEHVLKWNSKNYQTPRKGSGSEHDMEIRDSKLELIEKLRPTTSDVRQSATQAQATGANLLVDGDKYDEASETAQGTDVEELFGSIVPLQLSETDLDPDPGITQNDLDAIQNQVDELNVKHEPSDSEKNKVIVARRDKDGHVVLQHFEGEEIPSPDDFIDLSKQKPDDRWGSRE